MTLTRINLITAVFWVLLCNLSFFRHVLGVYPLTLHNSGFLLSLALGLTAFIFLFLTLVTARLTYKPILTLLLIAASATTYFMDYYHVVIDHTMIRNIVETNVHEAMDLFSPKLLGYVAVLGVLPSLLVWKSKVAVVPWRRALFCKVRDALIATVTVLGLVLLFSRFYASFFREHKPLRYYTNPTYMLYSIGKYANKSLAVKPEEVKPFRNRCPSSPHRPGPGTDYPRDRRVGPGRPLLAQRLPQADESAFAAGWGDLLSADVLQRHVNRLLRALHVFQLFRDQFSERKGAENENLLDVLRHAGVNVLWRDNNSDSKGVAVRVPYMDYKTPRANPDCGDGECRDEGMLTGLQEYIDAQPEGDITIVLHQMGNHGPAYYKRYPQSFERFTPTCKTNQLEECSNEEIGNTYDNAILYTDYFLDKVISLLKKNNDRFETAMFYMSDHGESLGEYGIYLHSLPYAMAPEGQKHVASVLWFGDNYKINRKAVAQKANQPFTHDNFFHTVLGLMEIETSTYNKNLDILNGCIPSS